MPKSKAQCGQIKDDTKKKIIDKSILYFSKNGFAGTKISDLASFIGIAQGTMYNYFDSKEALFEEINKIINNQDLSMMKQLTNLPIKADKKIDLLSGYIIQNLKDNQEFAAVLTLSTQQMYENGDKKATQSTYCSEAYKLLAQIIIEGQKEGCVVEGNVMKLVDYYWGVAYLYALKKLFTKDYELISARDLSRVLLLNH